MHKNEEYFILQQKLKKHSTKKYCCICLVYKVLLNNSFQSDMLLRFYVPTYNYKHKGWY